MRKISLRASYFLGFFLISSTLLAADPANLIANVKTVKFHYTLTVDNKVLSSTQGQEPVSYIQGEGKLIPGLEKKMEGMQAGEKKQIKIPQEDAYGPVDPTAVAEVPISKLPQDGVQPGSMLSVNDPQGGVMHAMVKEVKGETAVLDFNHPLAGKELQFDVEIIEIS